IQAIDVQYLSSNQVFHDIDINSDTLTSGQSVALNLIGNPVTNLRYIFSGAFSLNSGAAVTVAANVSCVLGGNFTVASGASLAFGASDTVLVGPAGCTTLTLADNGTVTFTAGDTVTLAATAITNVAATAQIVVGNNALLQATSTPFQDTLINSNATASA